MQTPAHSQTLSRPAFTLMEMMVSISILVVLMLSVGVIFKSASSSVGISEASTEMLSNVSAIQSQIERDLSGLAKDGFLVIRSSTFVVPSTGYKSRSDQIAFMSYGSFVNRTGSDNTAVFTDNNTRIPAALVWWGQLALEKSSGSNTQPTSPGVFLSTASSSATYKVPLNQVPTGIKESDFALGRHTTLLVPYNGKPPFATDTNQVSTNGLLYSAYPSSGTISGIDYANTNNVPSLEAIDYDLTQSRISAAQCTPGQAMSLLMQGVQSLGATRTGSNARFEADHYCFRYAAVTSPFDGDPSLPANELLYNGYFRMHPIALQGVSSFAIEWTDGSVYNGSEIDPATGKTVISSLVNTTRWYGPGNAKSGNNTTNIVDPAGVVSNSSAGDTYAAVFSYDNHKLWPTALRFRYHVADVSGRLTGGRDFVQVVRLPN